MLDIGEESLTATESIGEGGLFTVENVTSTGNITTTGNLTNILPSGENAIITLPAGTSPAEASPVPGVSYGAVFLETDADHLLLQPVSSDTFNIVWELFGGLGYRLVDVETIVAGGERKYMGIFREEGNIGHGSWRNADWNSFREKFDGFRDNGVEIIDFEPWTTSDGQQSRYAGAFLQSSDRHSILVPGVDSLEHFHFLGLQLINNGYGLVDYEQWFDEDGIERYGGIFRQGAGGQLLLSGISWFNLEDRRNELSNMRLIDLEIDPQTSASTNNEFSGVFMATTESAGQEAETITQGAGQEAETITQGAGQEVEIGLDWAGLEQMANSLKAQGLQLIDVEVYYPPVT